MFVTKQRALELNQNLRRLAAEHGHQIRPEQLPVQVIAYVAETKEKAEEEAIEDIPHETRLIVLVMTLAGGRAAWAKRWALNDAPALHAADVGISVDTAADVAKAAAEIILLEQDLGVVHSRGNRGTPHDHQHRPGLPLDNVDPEAIERPIHWNIRLIERFMIVIGPISNASR